MECGGKRSATPLWIGNGTAGTAELRISRMARIRNGIGTAKAVPRPMALSPQSKGNSRDGRWRKTTKVAKSAKSEISGGASSVLPGLRIGIGQPNSPATDGTDCTDSGKFKRSSGGANPPGEPGSGSPLTTEGHRVAQRNSWHRGVEQPSPILSRAKPPPRNFLCEPLCPSVVHLGCSPLFLKAVFSGASASSAAKTLRPVRGCFSVSLCGPLWFILALDRNSQPHAKPPRREGGAG